MHKKLMSIALYTSIITYCAAETQVVDNSGKTKISYIMSHAETGIAAYNKNNIHCAETQNLVQDLNIPVIAEFFECKTIVGNSFIAETLQSPVNSIDRDTILANRQTAIKSLAVNQAVRDEIGLLLEEAREAEQEVIMLLSEFFKGKTCPELKNLELIRQQNPGLAPIMEFLLTHKTGKAVTTSLNVLGLGAILFAARQFYPIIRLMIQTGNYNTRLMGGITYLGLIAGLNVYALYKDYSLASEKRAFIHGLNRLVAILKKLRLYVKNMAFSHNLKSAILMTCMANH
jgi:hypothetical protein